MRQLALAASVLALLIVSSVPVAAGNYPSGAARLADLIRAEHKRVCGSDFGLRAYQHNALAEWRSRDMVERSYFSHTVKGTSNNVFDYLDDFGNTRWRQAGEIIAWNSLLGLDAAEMAFRQFMGSDGHRALVQKCGFNTFGVGAYVDGRSMFTVTFSTQPVETVNLRMRIRSGPSPSYSVRFYAERGDRVYIFRGPRNGYDYGWLPGLGWGWVYGRYTS